MGVLQVSVQPGVADLFFIDLSGRQERLRVVSVDHVSVDVDVIEVVVLSDTLGLIVELLRRSIVVDSDI